MWEMFNRSVPTCPIYSVRAELPYKDMTDGALIIEVTKGLIAQLLTFDSTAPRELVEIVHSCWHMDPSHRPSFGKIVEQLEAI